MVTNQDVQLWHLAWDMRGGRRDILPVIHQTGRESFLHELVEMIIDANSRRMNIELPKQVETTQRTGTPSTILQHLGTVGHDIMGIIDVREADSRYSLDVSTLLSQPQATQESLSQGHSIDSEGSLPGLQQDDSKISSKKAGVAVKTIVDIPSSEADKFKSTKTRDSLEVREIPSVTKRGELPSTGILEIPKKSAADIPSERAEEIPPPSGVAVQIPSTKAKETSAESRKSDASIPSPSIEGNVKEHAMQDKIQPSKTGLPPEVSVSLPKTVNPQAVNTPPNIASSTDSTIGNLSKRKVRIESKAKLGSPKSDDVRQSTGVCQESVRPDPYREDKRTEGLQDGTSLSLTLPTEEGAGAGFTTRKRSGQPGVSLHRTSSSGTMRPTVASKIAFAVKQFKAALLRKEKNQESSDLCSLHDSGKEPIGRKVQNVQTRDRKAKSVTIMNKKSSADIKAKKKDFKRVCEEPEVESVSFSY